MSSLSAISEELGELDGQINDIFRALSNGFLKLEKIKDANRRSRQLEELTDKMRECKRYISAAVLSMDVESHVHSLFKSPLPSEQIVLGGNPFNLSIASKTCLGNWLN